MTLSPSPVIQPDTGISRTLGAALVLELCSIADNSIEMGLEQVWV